MHNKLDAITLYMSEIGGFTLLSDSETRILARQAHEGDEYAREELINHNLKLAAMLARNYLRPGLDWLELISWANQGLIEAVDKWDYTQPTKFSSYARMVISSRLRDGARTERLQPITDYTYRQIKEIKAKAKDFSSVYEREPSCEELVKEFNGKYTALKIAELLGQARQAESLDAAYGDDDDLCLGDTIGTDDDYNF